MLTRARDWLIVALLRGIIITTRPLPFDIRVIWGGRIISFIVSRIPTARKRVFENLARVFPKNSHTQNNIILKKVTKNFGMNLVEFYNMPEFAARQKNIKPNGDGAKFLQTLIDQNKSAIFVSGHLGNWEVFRSFMNARGKPLASIYKENSNPHYERIFLNALTHSGPAFATGVKGMAGLIRHLRSGNMISLLHDQRIKFAPVLSFMGHDAHTSLATAEMAIKYDIPIIPIYAIRENEKSAFTLIIEKPIPKSDALTMSQAMNDSLSSRIAQNPEQWYWFHKRWQIYDK